MWIVFVQVVPDKKIAEVEVGLGLSQSSTAQPSHASCRCGSSQ
jgi:hypothetical protein